MKKIILIIICLLNVQLASAQWLTPLRSTLGIAGHSKNVTLDGRSYLVQQSIGQESVIGLFKPGTNVLIQGFIRPNSRSHSSTKSPLATSIFPNPFYDRFTIEIEESIILSSDIIITDMMGRTVYNEKCSDRQRCVIDAGDLSPGHYILKISTSKKIHTAKLTKQ
jgi:hypothetical protein